MVDRIRVLHVDDDPDFTELVATFLERQHDRFDVETVTRPDVVLDRLDDVDCVVCDHDMPGMTGIELLRAVREDHPELPFILFTGKGSEEVASEAISAGVTDYLQKGSDAKNHELLANRITNAVEAARSRRTLTERTRRLETLIGNLPGIVYRCRNEPGRPMETVEGDVEELTGYTATAIETDAVAWDEAVVHPDDRDDLWDSVQAALSERDSFAVSYRIRTNAGETRWVLERGRGVAAPDGSLDTLEGFIMDVTDRRHRERSLRRTSARLEALFENSPDMINVHDTEGNLIDPNPQLCEKTGYDEAELREMKVWDLDPTIDPEEADALWGGMEAGERRRFEGRFQRKDGSTFPVEIHIRRLDLAGDDQFVVISRDISERAERDRELERYETIVETTDDIAFVVDTDWTVEYVNQSILDYVDVPLEDLEGQPVMALADRFHGTGEGPEQFEETLERAFDADATADLSDRLELRLDLHRGETVFEYQFSPLIEDGETTAVVITMRDITERKRHEQQLQQQTERHQEFTRVVSHDLRNPLGVASGRVELARQECDSEHLEDAANALDRMDELIDDLLTLAREGDRVSDLTPVSLADTVQGCWRNVATETATLVVEIDRTIEADEGRLNQLLENLLQNAIKHGGADVTVTVGTLEDGFFVADDGVGIPPADRDAVFESGYTDVPDGTGFGLAIVETIAEAHGWTISVTESDEGGARFEITGVTFAEQSEDADRSQGVS